MRNLCEQNSFCTITFYFNWPNFLSVGIVDVAFQNAGTGQYATPTRHLKFQFAPLAVSYELFPRWNQRPLDFFSITPNNTLQLSSGEFRVSYFRKKSCQAAIMQDSWHVLPYMVHVTSLQTFWKLLETLCRMTFSVADVRIASRLVERGKDKTVRNSTSLKLTVGTVIAKVLNCIPRFRIVYINTTAFLFMVR